MSIFKTKWSILKISKISWSDFLYTIFTHDYWIIKASKKNSKREKTLDLWYLINFEIETKDKKDIHKIRNIKIFWEFQCENKSFSEINMYLTLLWVILKKSPIWVPIYEIIDILETIIKNENIDEAKLILAKLKVIDILWELNTNHHNQTISKILKFINQNKIWDIFRLTWISDEIKEELKKIEA